jgi:hypothetical protein
LKPIIAGEPAWTDGAGVTHTDARCPRRAPTMTEGVADGWLCAGCVLVEVVTYRFGRVPSQKYEKATFGDWRDGRSRAAIRRRRTLRSMP